MTVPAHSSAYGVTWRHTYHVNEIDIWTGPDRIHSGPYQSAYAYPDAYNYKLGYVGNRVDPTYYERVIVSEMEDVPHIWKQVELYPDGSHYWTTQWLTNMRSHVDPMSFTFPVSFLNELGAAGAKAKTTALNRLSENKAQFGSSILEMRRTAHMVAGNVTSVIRGIQAWKHGKGIQSLQDLYRDRELAKRYLEFQYGYMPLLGDIHAGADLLSRGIKADNFQIRATSTEKVTHNTGWVPSGDFESKLVCNGRAYARLDATIRSSYLEFFNSAGLINPAEVAWEFVPYSFIVDWFVPIGNCLSALSASAGLDLGSTSMIHTFYEGIYELRTRGSTYPMPYGIGSHGRTQQGYYKVGAMVFNRSPLYGAWPIPELYNKKNPFTTTHILNAIALIAARF